MKRAHGPRRSGRAGRGGARRAMVGLRAEQLEPRQLMAGDVAAPAAPEWVSLNEQFVRQLLTNDGTGAASPTPWLDLHTRDLPSISAVPGPPPPPPPRRPEPGFVVSMDAPPIDSPVAPTPTVTTNPHFIAPLPIAPTADGCPRPPGPLLVSGTRPLPAHRPTPVTEPFSETWTAADNDAARFAEEVYWWEGRGFQDLGIRYQPTDGFQASLFQAEDGTYYLAFRGTEFWSLDDWEANFKQHLGIRTSQYEQAYLLALAISRRLARDGSTLVLTGHSLGGSLATYAAERLGANAIVFNPSSVHPFVPDNPNAQIRSHVIAGDPLSVGRAIRNEFSFFYRQPRGRVFVQWPAELNTHGMGNFPARQD